MSLENSKFIEREKGYVKDGIHWEMEKDIQRKKKGCNHRKDDKNISMHLLCMRLENGKSRYTIQILS